MSATVHPINPSVAAAVSFRPTHRVELGGEVRLVNATDFDSVCDELVARYGGVPTVTPVLGLGDQPVAAFPGAVVTTAPVAAIPARPAAPPPSMDSQESVSASGKARAERDEKLALENGFAPKPPIYAIGTRVNELGVENATRSQNEHAAKPWAQDAMSQLAVEVKAESRMDLPSLRLADLRMTTSGRIALPKEHPVFAGASIVINPKMFGSLMGRFPCASGSAYLADCDPELRAINFNRWAARLEGMEAAGEVKQRDVVLRTRLVEGTRVGYAAVSPKYTSFDADVIARALEMAFPEDAKAVVDYDGERLRVEGLWHTDVKPNEFVAGEIFKAGVIIDTDDTGGGSIRVRSMMWRNLCLNLIILDKAVGVDVRIKHQGSVEKLAQKFREAFGQALSSVNPFRNAWNAAYAEQGSLFTMRVQGTTSEDLSKLSPEGVLEGVFNGIIERELVPVRGNRKATVPKLLEMHAQDEAASAYGVSRASVANALTRYAHRVETDPFFADEIRAGAGALLSGHRGGAPSPLPYVALT